MQCMPRLFLFLDDLHHVEYFFRRQPCHADLVITPYIRRIEQFRAHGAGQQRTQAVVHRPNAFPAQRRAAQSNIAWVEDAADPHRRLQHPGCVFPPVLRVVQAFVQKPAVRCGNQPQLPGKMAGELAKPSGFD